ncbi:MAG: transketolase-like TK C-terminal-containing protein, partial [Chitinophagaceae bacterium]
FREQPEAYRNEVLPPSCTKRLAVEAGSPQGWEEWVGEKGKVIGITRFGESAPEKILFEKFGFTIENIINKTKSL